MAETYSIATVGYNANSPASAQPVILPDSAARVGNEASVMATNGQILCKGPDGAQRLYTIDSGRSRPGGPIYLLAVGP